jgi:F-box interacting protein
VYGFGYCPVNHHYKVVRLFTDSYFSEDVPRCEVLVLRAPAYWRPAVQQPPVCIVEEHNPAVFLNGRLHFLCQDGGIVTFDVSDENFGSLPPLVPPYPEENGPAVTVRMTDLDGCLCLCREKADGDGPYQVWLLRDYHQWEQLCCFDRRVWPEPERSQLQTQWITLLSMCDGQKKIMFGTGTRKVFAVDRDGGAPGIMLSPDEDIAGCFSDMKDYPAIGLFEESLVPLGRIEEEMYLLSPTMKAWWDVL